MRVLDTCPQCKKSFKAKRLEEYRRDTYLTTFKTRSFFCTKKCEQQFRKEKTCRSL